MALAEFLRYAQTTGAVSANADTRPLAVADSNEPAYAEALDLRARLESLDELKNWRATSKLGFDNKLKRLNDAIDGFVHQPKGGLLPVSFSREVPREEFALLRVAVQSILSDAEAALQR
jgi:hypothetical protein